MKGHYRGREQRGKHALRWTGLREPRDAGAEMLRQGFRNAGVGMLPLGSWCGNVGLGSKRRGNGCEMWPKQRAEVWQGKAEGSE